MSVGSSSGEQYESQEQFTMGIGGPEKATGASKYNPGTQVAPIKDLPSEFPKAPGPESFHIDRTKDVPLAASALHKDGQFYGIAIDKDAPKTDMGIPGWDPAHGVFLHERAEFDHMNNLIKSGMSTTDAYHEAHDKIATPMETAYVRAVASVNGKDPDAFHEEYKQYWRDVTSNSTAKEDPDRHPDAHTTTFGLDESELGRGLRKVREFLDPTGRKQDEPPVPIGFDIGTALGLGMLAMGEKMGTGGLPRSYKPTPKETYQPPLERAKQLGYDQPTFHGTTKEFRGKGIEDSEFYSTSNPELADLYAGAGKGQDLPYSKASHQVVPLLLKTKNYHEIDAGGDIWMGKGQGKISQALDYAIANKKDGVIVRNIHDEPSGGSKELPPQDIFITLKGETARSWFAKFDPKNMHLNDLLASGIATMIPAGAMLKDKDK